MQFAFAVPLSWSRPVSAAKEGKGHRRKSRQVRPIAAVDCQKPSALHSQMFLACRDSSQFVSTTVQRAGFGKISFVFKAKAQIFILTNSEGSQVTLMYRIGFKYWSFFPLKKNLLLKSPFYNGAVFVCFMMEDSTQHFCQKTTFPLHPSNKISTSHSCHFEQGKRLKNSLNVQCSMARRHLTVTERRRNVSGGGKRKGRRGEGGEEVSELSDL